jgi:6-phosphogluconolactonase (cycloisomerase 2 family)
MSTAAIRSLALSLILTSLVGLLALGGCGTTGTRVCSLSGCCGPTSDACVVPQFLYANGLNGQIDVFPIINGSGIPSSPTSVSGPANSLGLAALSSQFLYASNPPATVGGTSSIDAWAIAPGTGTLTPLPGSPFSLGPLSFAAGLAVNSTAQILYVADAGKIDALQADATGALTPILGSPFLGGGTLYLTVDPLNRFVFASDDAPPGNIAAFTIGSTGALTAAPGSPFATIPGYIGTTRPSQIVTDPTGSFVYTGLLTTGQVAGFSINATTGALTPVPGSPFPAGNNPLSLAAVNNFLYVSNFTDGTISGYSINPTNGALTALAGSPFAIHGGPLVASPFGGFLYTTGPGGLLAFSINPQTGALTQVGSAVPDGGATVLTFVP